MTSANFFKEETLTMGSTLVGKNLLLQEHWAASFVSQKQI